MSNITDRLRQISQSAAAIRQDWEASQEDRLERTLSLIEDLADELAEALSPAPNKGALHE